MSDNMPKSVWHGTFKLFGVDVHCHVLDDGRRIIEEESMVQLLQAMGDSAGVDQHELEEFVRWQKRTPR